MDSRTDEEATKLLSVFCVSVERQILCVVEKATLDIGDIARNLSHPSTVGMGCESVDVD